jgi:excisionase family DNA binding protein
MDKFLSVKELSQLLSIKQSTIYFWAHQGIIPYYKIKKLIRFREEEIKEWLIESNSDKCIKKLNDQTTISHITQD